MTLHMILESPGMLERWRILKVGVCHVHHPIGRMVAKLIAAVVVLHGGWNTHVECVEVIGVVKEVAEEIGVVIVE